jgi:hypothetical protein
MQRMTEMKKVTVNKMNRVNAPEGDDAIAYQIVQFVIDYFGSIVETTHDTAIYADGRQVVIDGCGLIPEGYEL